MLVEFTVGNYRSIKDPVTLSAVATKQRKTAATGKRRPGVVPDEEIAPAYPVEGRGFGLLPVLGIFGANASGKSNVLRALNDFLFFTTQGTGVDNFIYDKIMPFVLDEVSETAPIVFDVTLLIEGRLYLYSLHLDRQRILHEQLEYSPPSTGRTRLLYARTWNPLTQIFDWKNGEDFRGPHILLQSGIQEKEPFLALVMWSVVIDVIIPLVSWLEKRWPRINVGATGWDAHRVAQMLTSNPLYLERLSRLIHSLDTDVERIVVERQFGSLNRDHEIYTVHQTNAGEIRLRLSEESNGTQRLIILGYPLLLALEEGGLLLIDELDASLHPEITQTIIKLFQRQDTNPKRAQLIFTSHENTLMRDHLLRRDQLWLAEKRRDQSTNLYSLSDYRLRNDALVDLGYLNGRFGAVPILPADDYLTELVGV